MVHHLCGLSYLFDGVRVKTLRRRSQWLEQRIAVLPTPHDTFEIPRHDLNHPLGGLMVSFVVALQHGPHVDSFPDVQGVLSFKAQWGAVTL